MSTADELFAEHDQPSADTLFAEHDTTSSPPVVAHPAATPPAPLTSSKSSAWDAAVAGLAKGGTFGFDDEISGGIQALASKLSGDDKSFGDLYRQNRDEARDAGGKTAEQHPYAYHGAELAGAMAVPIPGAGEATGAAKLARMALQGAGVGGLFAAGDSNADLTKGQVAQFANDTGKGALVGGAIGGLSGGLSKLAEKWGISAGAKAQAARDLAKQRAEEAVAKEIASAQGAARSAVQSASRDVEVIQHEAAFGSGEAKKAAQAWLAAPENQAIIEKRLAGKFRDAPQRIAEMTEKDAQHAALVGGRDEAVAAKIADQLENPIAKQLAPRIATLGHRALGAALTAGGALAGLGTGHAGLGLATGAVAGLSSQLLGGRPGVILKNLYKAPGTQNMLYGGIEKLLAEDPNLAGKVGGAGKEGVTRVLELLAGPAAGGAGDDAVYRLLQRVAGKDEEAPPDMQARR